MKKLLYLPILLLVFSCSEGVLDGKYLIISHNQDSASHFEQYFTFKGVEFRSYMIENGKKVFYEDSLSTITYNDNNTFSFITNDSLYTFKYSINKDTLKLEIGNNLITLLKQMSKEKAIARLKELKELLELDVITQEDYDIEKAKLTPSILGN